MREHARGLTLMELLVAISILAVLGLVLSQSLLLARRVQNSTASRYAEISDQQILERTLRSLLISRLRDSEFAGEKFSVFFEAEPDPRLAGGGAYRIHLHLADGALVADWHSEKLRREGRSILLKRAGGLSFSYGANENDDLVWGDQWPERKPDVPQLLRLNFEDGREVIFRLK